MISIQKVAFASIFLMLLGNTPNQKHIPETIAQNNNLFAFDLYQRVAEKEDGNLFFSPFSISTALAMTYAGADAQTATEMAKTMHFGPNEPDFHYAYGSYLNVLEDNAKGNIQLRIANRLWGEKTYKLRDDFVALNKRAYDSPLKPMDFINNPVGSRTQINDWVADKTEQRIRDLLPEGVITTDTRLVLTNAIYFKADWLYQFKEKKTKEKKFYLANGEKTKVPFMHFEGAFDFYRNDKFKMIKLPYKGGKQSMVVVLPNEGVALADVESAIKPSMFSYLQGYKPDVELALPKFKATLPLLLNDYLIDMGMSQAFTNSANFSKMSDGQALMISDVIHKAFIEINEEGTEAAAATAVVTVITSTVQQEIKPETFIANHPFLFYIIDDETQAILFMGRIDEPGN
jgi:serpin B